MDAFSREVAFRSFFRGGSYARTEQPLARADITGEHDYALTRAPARKTQTHTEEKGERVNSTCKSHF